MAKIEKVKKGQVPSLLDTNKANELIGKINGLLSSTADAPLDLTVNGDGSISISIDTTQIGGLPDGYVETDVILCINGSPVAGQFLFKED